MSGKKRNTSSSNPNLSQESRQSKNERKRLQRAEMPASKKEELGARRKIRRLERKITERELTTIPIQYDNELHKFCTTIETDLVTESSNIVGSLPATTTVSQIGMS